MSDRTPLVLVHGFWHGSWCWSDVLTYVAAAGRIAVPVDMVGHGLAARRPDFLARPSVNVDSDGSLVAGITLDHAADRLIAQIELIGGGQPVTVVAHSMAGTVLTRVAQREPRLIARAVYLAAFMPESGIAAVTYFPAPENAGELVCELFQGDPEAIGALRFDLASDDPAYRQQLRDAFFGDLERVIADAAIGLFTPDAPVQIPLEETQLTADGWGAVPRTYLACSRDMAIRPALQERFISSADAAFPNNPTSVEWLDASHSPFLSMPRHLADILTGLD